ncbi:MAG: permease prefix domain 1-containing protein [Gemmatimonadaceae bacterium]
MIRRRFFQHENARDSVPRAVDEELEFQLSTRVDALVAKGWNPEEARREAERQFGSVDGVRGSCIELDHERERAVGRMNPVCLALTRLLGSQLHGVGAVDPVSAIGAVVVLGVSAALAAISPAVRASRVAPMRAIGM